MDAQQIREHFSEVSSETHGVSGLKVTATLGGKEYTCTAESESDALGYFLETYPPLVKAEKPALEGGVELIWGNSATDALTPTEQESARDPNTA